MMHYSPAQRAAAICGVALVSFVLMLLFPACEARQRKSRSHPRPTLPNARSDSHLKRPGQSPAGPPSNSSTAQQATAKPAQTASHVVAYSFNRMQYAHWPFLVSVPGAKSVGLAADRQPANGIVLSSASAAKLAAQLNKAEFSPALPAPFRPQHALVFYDDRQRILRAIEVCFGCRRAQECSGLTLQRRECALNLSVAAHVFSDAGIPLSGNGDDATDFDRSIKKH